MENGHDFEDMSMATDAELDQMLGEALGLPPGGIPGLSDAPVLMKGDALLAGPDSSVMLDDLQQLQNQLLALQPQPNARTVGSSQMIRGDPNIGAGTRLGPAAPIMEQNFLAPPKQTYGHQSGTGLAGQASAGGIWAGKLATAQGAFANVLARVLITKDRPAPALEEYVLQRWPTSNILQITSFHAVNSSDLQLLISRTQCPLLELVPMFSSAGDLPSDVDPASPRQAWEQFQNEMMNGRLVRTTVLGTLLLRLLLSRQIAVVPFPGSMSRTPEGLVLFAQPNRIFAGCFVGPRYAPLPHLVGPSVLLNFQQAQQRLLSQMGGPGPRRTNSLPDERTIGPAEPRFAPPNPSALAIPRQNTSQSAAEATIANDLLADSDLAVVIRSWPSLSYETKAAILAVVRAAGGR
ncbi:hypothetical protein DFJ74DRAFT_400979 [Hyaloraphidium curvatum]|nr:hypothetical protein DFJ74DRAFT_400979 [Hyaloraphidium curvatum]